MGEYIRLMRMKHWVKNGLCFLPLIFGKQMFCGRLFFSTLGGAMAFSLLSSMVYVINDIQDREKDRLHATKRNRPIAAGTISVKQAGIFACMLFLISLTANVIFSGGGYKCIVILLIYLAINLYYSCFGGKNIAVLDIILLVAGFFLRVLYGATLTGIPISDWLYLTVITVAFYMAFGKRRNEMRGQQKDTRGVLKYYTVEFLDKNMYMCMAVAIIFYSLWCLDISNVKAGDKISIVWTVPIVLILAMRYSYDVEKETSEGDPVEVILADKFLIITGFLYFVLVIAFVYLG